MMDLLLCDKSDLRENIGVRAPRAVRPLHLAASVCGPHRRRESRSSPRYFTALDHSIGPAVVSNFGGKLLRRLLVNKMASVLFEFTFSFHLAKKVVI